MIKCIVHIEFAKSAIVGLAWALMAMVSAPCRGATASFDGGLIVANSDKEYAEGGAWEDGNIKGDYYRYGMDNTESRKTSQPGAWAQWTPDLKAGKYRVYFWHIVFGARGPVTIEIRHAGGTATIKREIADGHTGWNHLGDYEFAAGTGGFIKLTLDGKGTLYANAAKFLPIDRVDKTTFPPYPKPDGSLPRAQNGNMIICGQPRLLLYGETLEETMTHPADVPYYGDAFDKWRRQGLNTLGAVIQWNAFEPRKDQYEYAMIDGLIDEARQRNMHLIIVWFGTWRNLQSGYVPKYVWDEGIAFPALKQDGKPENGGVSQFATRCAERDGLALNRLLARAAQKDPGHQVLVAVQVENEMPGYADHSPAANERIGEQVPKELLEYLKSIDTQKHDPAKMGWFTWSRYHGNGSRTSGTWEEVFGKQPWPGDARKALGVYYTGKYIEVVVRKAKEALNIPMYANAWCGESPCDWEYMDIFHIGCPSLDGMGPDSGGDVLFKWVRPWNMLVEPEFSWGENYFRALSLGALLSGQYWNAEVELTRAPALYDLVRAMEPLLVTKRGAGDLLGFSTAPASGGHQGGGKFLKTGHTWEQDFQDLTIKFALTGDTVNYVTKPHTVGPVLGPNGLIIRMAPDEYIITSTKIDLNLSFAGGGDIGVAWAEEGHFESGRWSKDKDAAVEDAGKVLKLRFPTENGRYGQLRPKITHAPTATLPRTSPK
jgi:hypothetical protein